MGIKKKQPKNENINDDKGNEVGPFCESCPNTISKCTCKSKKPGSSQEPLNPTASYWNEINKKN